MPKCLRKHTGFSKLICRWDFFPTNYPTWCFKEKLQERHSGSYFNNLMKIQPSIPCTVHSACSFLMADIIIFIEERAGRKGQRHLTYKRYYAKNRN